MKITDILSEGRMSTKAERAAKEANSGGLAGVVSRKNADGTKRKAGDLSVKKHEDNVATDTASAADKAYDALTTKQKAATTKSAFVKKNINKERTTKRNSTVDTRNAQRVAGNEGTSSDSSSGSGAPATKAQETDGKSDDKKVSGNANKAATARQSAKVATDTAKDAKGEQKDANNDKHAAKIATRKPTLGDMAKSSKSKSSKSDK